MSNKIFENLSGDPQVCRTQIWLNETYGTDARYNRIPENGKTGWTTIYALIRALQIELGIQATADNFGATTERLFNEKYPQGIRQQDDSDLTEDNVYGIIQGALWCKGYSTGSEAITRHFYGGTGSGIKKLKRDVGISDATATISVNLMKALLSMDQFVLLSNYGGKAEIRSIQQEVNKNYPLYVGIIPCDGIYGRAMNKALIKVLQAVEGLTPSAATGTFGATTKAKLPLLPESENPEAIKLFRQCLTCNGYNVDTSLTSWSVEVENKVHQFQSRYALPVTGKGDINTWMSLLLSKGNPDRAAIACDCSTVLNIQQCAALYNAGYRYVGRYLTGTVGGTQSKAMTREEANNILQSGLKIFPIFQTGVPSLSRYTYDKGVNDAQEAYEAAHSLGVPSDTYIYFAVDYDIMDGEIVSTVIPYFRGIRAVFEQYNLCYRIGVYGARNVCSRLYKAGLASSSFVSDMSTGFSGNMGYPIPHNWAFDQFHEYTFENAGGNFALDKVAYSGRGCLFDGFTEYPSTPEPIQQITLGMAQEYHVQALSFFDDTLEWLGVVPEFGTTNEIVLPGMTIEISSGYGNNIQLGSEYSQATLEIRNGEFDNATVTSAFEVLDEFCTKLGISINKESVFSQVYNFVHVVENGSITFGIELLANDKIKVVYLTKMNHISSSTYENWTYLEYSITIDPHARDWTAKQLARCAALAEKLQTDDGGKYAWVGYLIMFALLLVVLTSVCTI